MNSTEFYKGEAFDAYTYFGAHPEGKGVTFRVYAPNAKDVKLEGDFSNWQEYNMYPCEMPGVYHAYIEGAKPGMLYKYIVYTRDGNRVEHSDPYGFAMELRPNWASVICDLNSYQFQDQQWMEQKRDKNYNRPMNIYEFYPGSFRQKPRKEGEDVSVSYLKYDEMAEELIAYLKENGFQYLEFLPLSEHPADCSWGYQNTGFYAPTSRYGTPDQLKKLIDLCHQNDIGVILDFVPVHFAIDSYGLGKFDGTPLYEFPSSDVALSEWGTYNFNHARGEVASFLQSCAYYWLKEFHFDGLRMDAISRMIYWQGNPDRGVNTCAVNFVKRMNYGLHMRIPEAILIAEDSTDFLKVTAPVTYQGLGFDYKWDMGFMNDTLEYFKLEPVHRPAHYHKLSFSMQYFYQELFLLALSHDEVVHGKATIIQKMWGQYEDKCSQIKAFYAYFYTHPGKKLNFMGNEIGQFREWDEEREQDWDLITYPFHDAFHHYYIKLCKLYETEPALYDGEYNPDCFEWLEVHAEQFSTYVYARKGGGEVIITALNLSDQFWKDFTFGIWKGAKLTELVNSDWECYGGHTKPTDDNCHVFPEGFNGKEARAVIDLAPFSARIFKVTFF
ncbi:MAG: 1,4-alpha-glucan branching protein GlgB [Lachnospiraceae bacterium]|nr:1,4-alpha-glucan branching protein GlgB [Lachnospiraceae bacterium]